MRQETGQRDLNQNGQKGKENQVDVVLIGGGIMSATLGSFLQQLEPNWQINLYECLSDVAQESSNGWNNAGTGHTSLAESNYTPLKADGSIDISKAIKIYQQFQLSRQFWAYLSEQGQLGTPSSFINSVPHLSFVSGQENVEFLRKRYQALSSLSLFEGMAYSEDPEQIRTWLPLMMEGRSSDQPIAATRSIDGTDVNFGELTRQMIDNLQRNERFSLQLKHKVTQLDKQSDGRWKVGVRCLTTGKEHTVLSRYVFIGAGGASLTLLQKSSIPEAKSYAGFPVGGQFLVTENPDLVNAHQAKVYGKAAVGAPPMSVPHMDTRVIDGKKMLLFGPFASFSSKFLKQGSLLDLFSSVTPHNVLPMMHVGLNNFDLVKYLVGQLTQSEDDRIKALQAFYPKAKASDWRLCQAGQRVQIIKKEAGKKAALHLGSELVHAKDGSLTALLGASPGASVSAAIMMELLERCFPEQMGSKAWQNKIQQMLPSYGQDLLDNPQLHQHVLAQTAKSLNLDNHLVELNTNVENTSHEAEKHQEADVA
ncbi:MULTISPECIES: malate dehydrogenase (quinone) [unclassified Vibrio]|uniref:Probable malate:quinone oxidoreductase n=1 Tax=Vibrio sp. HB236076 TaxID=3232307 RepID=A0AB39HEV2_9VIBR|nr:malate dehydrogenase (quinone) [Vibrio sp. HB161653]MDP5253083.1 malate dehydrogenase (quinone) [Vibrio sp. HB161653]